MFLLRSRYFVILLLLAVLVIFSLAYAFVGPPGWLTIFKLFISAVSGYGLFHLIKVEKRVYDKEQHEQRIRPLLLEKYGSFVKQKSEIFEERLVPLSTEELFGLQRAYRKSIVLAIGFCLSLTALCIWAWLASGDLQPKLVITGVTLMAISIVGYFLVLSKKFSQKKEKIIIRALITNKIWASIPGSRERQSRVWLFELSMNKLMLPVSRKDYNGFTLGDIVQIECYDIGSKFRRKIILVGKFEFD